MADTTRGNGSINPFKMPSDEEVFILRDEEKRQKQMERERLKKKAVHEKTTWSARIESAKLKSNVDDIDIIQETRPEPKVHADVNLPTVDKRVKDNMTKYIQKKRKMGLARMSLATKRQEVKKLDEEAERAEKRIAQQEEQIRETQGKFTAFLQYSDLEQVEAFRLAEEETKQKQDKIQDIKKKTAEITQVDVDRKKNEDMLQACLEYKKFLDTLTPPTFFHSTLIAIRTEDARNAIAAQTEVELNELAAEQAANEGNTEGGSTVNEGQFEREAIMARMAERCEEAAKAIEEEVDAMLPEEIKLAVDRCDPARVPMYFTKPEQILTKFVEIEEGNLFLINTCQDLEKDIEEVDAKAQAEEAEFKKQVASTRSQMDAVTRQINDEEAKMKALQERIARAKSGSGVDDQKKKEEVEAKVTQIYTRLDLGDESTLLPLGKLTQIEVKLEDMRLQILEQNIDKAHIQSVMKTNFKERRRLTREAHVNAKAEERKKRSAEALARAVGEVKKRVGKPVMWRSRPVDHRKKQDDTEQDARNSDDDFFL